MIKEKEKKKVLGSHSTFLGPSGLQQLLATTLCSEAKLQNCGEKRSFNAIVSQDAGQRVFWTQFLYVIRQDSSEHPLHCAQGSAEGTIPCMGALPCPR